MDTSRLVTKELDFKLRGYIRFDGERIYGARREPTDALFCFDLELNVLWKRELNKFHVLYCGEDAPQFFQHLVIFNGSVEPISKDAFAITAFAKADGQVVWTRVFECAPHRSILVGDKIYLAMRLRILILDAATGNTLVDEPTGFARYVSAVEVIPGVKVPPCYGEQPCLVFPANDCLFVFAHTAIRVFSLDGKTLLQEIQLPKPRSARAFDNFRAKVGHTPVIHNKCVYFIADSYTGLGAIGILSLAPEGEQPKITIKPRLPYTFETIPDGQGGHGYRLQYSHDNLDDLVSAVRFEITELTLYCGQFSRGYRQKHDHADPLFDGRVVVAVDKRLPDDAVDELKKTLAHAENFVAEVMLVVAPFQFMPESETEAKEATTRNRIRFELELHNTAPSDLTPKGCPVRAPT